LLVGLLSDGLFVDAGETKTSANSFKLDSLIPNIIDY